MKKTPDSLDDLGRFSEPALLILISLADGPKHGYAMTQDIERVSGQRLGPGHAVRRDHAARGAQVDRAAAGRRSPAAVPADRRRPEGAARAARQPARDDARRRRRGSRMRERLARRIVRVASARLARAVRAGDARAARGVVSAVADDRRLARGCASEWVRSSRIVRDLLAIVLAIACVGAAKLVASSIWGARDGAAGRASLVHGICGVLAVRLSSKRCPAERGKTSCRFVKDVRIRRDLLVLGRACACCLSSSFVLDTLSRGASRTSLPSYWDLRGWIDLDTVMMIGVFGHAVGSRASRRRDSDPIASCVGA